jgi:hypothetical protein
MHRSFLVFCLLATTGCGGMTVETSGDAGAAGDGSNLRGDAHGGPSHPPDGGSPDAGHEATACSSGTAWNVPSIPDAGGLLSITGIWGSGPDDVWLSNDVIDHWNGAAWSPYLDTGGTLAGLSPGGVWGSSADDVWMMSLDNATRAHILHWNGTAWSQTIAPGEPDVLSDGGAPPGSYVLMRVWGSGPDDVWSVGFDPFHLRWPAPIVHWSGTEWTLSRFPDMVLESVWGSGPDDVWAVGARGPRRAILHYDGTAWSLAQGGALDVPDASIENANDSLDDIWGTGPNDVWAVGSTCTNCDAAEDVASVCTDVLLHYDGTAWSQSFTQLGLLFGVWGTGPCDIWAVGMGNDGGPQVLHRDCSSWSSSPLPTAECTPACEGPLFRVWGSSSCDVWAGGASVFHYSVQ